MRHIVVLGLLVVIHAEFGSAMEWTNSDEELAGSDLVCVESPSRAYEDSIPCAGCIHGCDECLRCEPLPGDGVQHCDGCLAGSLDCYGTDGLGMIGFGEILLCSGCDDCGAAADNGCDGLLGGCGSGCDDCGTAPGEITKSVLCNGCDGGCDGCRSELSRLDLQTMGPNCSGDCDGGCKTRRRFQTGRLVGGLFYKPCSTCDGCCTCCRNYVSFFGGWNHLDDYSGELGPPPVTNLRGTFDDGFGLGLAIGRRLQNCYRGELEFSFRRNTADSWIINGVAGPWVGGLSQYSGMANLYRDLPGLQLYGCVPYVGGGVGFTGLRGTLNTTATSILVDDFAFSCQFIAGGSKNIGERVDLFTEYRYLTSFEVDFTNVGVVPAVVLDTDRLDNHGLFFGLRYYH